MLRTEPRILLSVCFVLAARFFLVMPTVANGKEDAPTMKNRQDVEQAGQKRLVRRQCRRAAVSEHLDEADRGRAQRRSVARFQKWYIGVIFAGESAGSRRFPQLGGGLSVERGGRRRAGFAGQRLRNPKPLLRRHAARSHFAVRCQARPLAIDRARPRRQDEHRIERRLRCGSRGGNIARSEQRSSRHAHVEASASKKHRGRPGRASICHARPQ